MSRACLLTVPAVVVLLLSGCEMSSEFDRSPRSNFDAFWKMLDENYCFFDYKHIDWNEMYDKYSPKVNDAMSERELFELLSALADELQDGHINITAEYYSSSYDGWHADYPANFNWFLLQDKYLANGARAGDYDEIRYTRLADNKVGYIYYGSFQESILESELNGIFDSFKNCEGLIVDVRNNGGGSLTNSDRLAARFFNTKTLCGYIRHKTGKGHNDFSEPYPLYLQPSNGDLWLKPVIILTNRRCFSAANNVVSKMSVLSNVCTLGASTGGGSGFPFTSELPNGWHVRFSASPILDVNMQHTEFGIEPDFPVNLTNEDLEKGKDTLIETAILLLTDSLLRL
jgi:hypothetical protein